MTTIPPPRPAPSQPAIPAPTTTFVNPNADGRGAGRARSLVGVSLGNALEVFDWTAYAVFAPFFASQIFHDTDPTAALLATFVVFGAGFVVRPFGGFLFGWIADRYGRRSSLLTAISFASVGMFMIAVVPTYDTIGLGAAAVLLVARLLQGLAHTGEVASAYTYVAEVAPPARRGLWSSAIYMSLTAAIVAATLLGALLTSVLSDAAMSSWGWRVPFVVGTVLGVFTIVLRRRMPESEMFVEVADSEPAEGVWASLWTHRVAGLRVFLVMGAVSALFYAWGVAGTSWGIGVAGLDPTSALWAGVIALVISIAVLPAAGALSDRIGRRGNFYLFALGVGVLAYPMDRLAREGVIGFGIATTVMLALYALVGSILPALFSELFPTGVRATGIAVPYALSAIVFAGTTPYLQQWLARNDAGTVFPIYLSVAAVVGGLVMHFTPETRGTQLR